MANKSSIIKDILEPAFPHAFFLQRQATTEVAPSVYGKSSEMPPALDAYVDAASGGGDNRTTITHLIDGLVPLRAINPLRRGGYNSGGAAVPEMLASDLVQMFRRRLEMSMRRFSSTTTVLSFDKSRYVPITKGVEQEKRRGGGDKKKEPTEAELEEGFEILDTALEIGDRAVTD